MEMEHGKLFIGGISWDTNEERLKEYFQTFGEVIEAVIMKDRTTGRARGFGFIVFLNPAVAERVVKLKHIIDGRTVEAKKAVPRDDQQTLNKPNMSPGPIRTKKIFVGGLASTVTEADFKNYFDQFGSTTDVVVMYDHNTQRPRGFGFITYDSEESVERVLLRTFHELNGKMVEVKRAVPKESISSSPVPNRSIVTNGYSNNQNYGLSNKVGSYFNGYGYNPSSLGRFSPFIGSDPVLRNFDANIGYAARAPNRFAGAGGYGGDSLMNHEMWGNVNVNGNGNGNQSYDYSNNNSMNSRDFIGLGEFGSIWGNSSSGGGVNVIGYGRNRGSSGAPAVDEGGSFYTDATWGSLSGNVEEVEVSGLFNYGFGNGGSERKSVGYVGYSDANRSNRGIEA